jgi:hypothetical protein
MNMIHSLNQVERGFDLSARRACWEAVEDVMQMIFRLRGKDVNGRSAIEVVRALERADKEYRYCGAPIRQYLIWSLNRLNGTVPPRDLDLSDRLEDEPLALGYLLLLDEYGVGKIVEPTNRSKE